MIKVVNFVQTIKRIVRILYKDAVFLLSEGYAKSKRSVFVQRQPRITFVTGATADYYHAVLRLVSSVRKYEPGSKMVVWDLGLTGKQVMELCSMEGLVLRKFRYEDYPDHYNPNTCFAGSYAWKATILAFELKSDDQYLMWLDAACVLRSPLMALRKKAKKRGIFCPTNEAKIGRWTHMETWMRMSANSEWHNLKSVSSGMVIVNITRSSARNLVKRWSELSSEKEVITPDGASYDNHRYDQSLLTLLLLQNNMYFDDPYHIGVRVVRE